MFGISTRDGLEKLSKETKALREGQENLLEGQDNIAKETKARLEPTKSRGAPVPGGRTKDCDGLHRKMEYSEHDEKFGPIEVGNRWDC
jgi:hypothetical protein